MISIKSKLFYYSNIASPIYKRIPGGLVNRRYELLEDWIFYSKIDVPHDYADGLLIIQKSVDGGTFITVKKGFIWNGATFAPDFKPVLPGTIIHDAVYERLNRIAFAWNTTKGYVRRWGDNIFDEINLAFKFWKILARIYFFAVRIFGIVVKWFGKT